MSESLYRTVKLILLAVFVVGFLVIVWRFTGSVSGSWSKIADSSAKIAENGRFVQYDDQKGSYGSDTTTNGVTTITSKVIDTRTGAARQVTHSESP